MEELSVYCKEDTKGIVRSLTGGVAYADANGNKSSSTNYAGYGAWPTNSEWDKFIVNFPTDLIQSGKTLDDVFHWNNIYTWCQDTPNITAAPSTNRVYRGSSHPNRWGYIVSTTVDNTRGFRPVFEYKEP